MKSGELVKLHYRNKPRIGIIIKHWYYTCDIMIPGIGLVRKYPIKEIQDMFVRRMYLLKSRPETYKWVIEEIEEQTELITDRKEIERVIMLIIDKSSLRELNKGFKSYYETIFKEKIQKAKTKTAEKSN